jgi:sec-independent protein translocase protein TatA
MGPLGYPEMVVIFLIILLLFGAKKLPGLARGVGKSMGEFRKAKDEFEHEITRAEDEVTSKASEPKSTVSKESTPRDSKEG